MKKFRAVLFVLLIAATSSLFASSKEDVENAIAKAEAAVKKALDVNFAWRDSEKMIESAKEALQAKDYAKAAKLAEKAEKQGELAYAQYEHETDASKKVSVK